MHLKKKKRICTGTVVENNGCCWLINKMFCICVLGIGLRLDLCSWHSGFGCLISRPFNKINKFFPWRISFWLMLSVSFLLYHEWKHWFLEFIVCQHHCLDNISTLQLCCSCACYLSHLEKGLWFLVSVYTQDSYRIRILETAFKGKVGHVTWIWTVK